MEPRSPGVSPVAGASLMILCQTLAAILTLFSVCSLAIMAAGHHFDLPYSVELWDEGDTRVEELIALTADYNVARAAYQEAMKRRPGRIVTLRQKTRVLADSRRQT
jgi:hypothetical protein